MGGNVADDFTLLVDDRRMKRCTTVAVTGQRQTFRSDELADRVKVAVAYCLMNAVDSFLQNVM